MNVVELLKGRIGADILVKLDYGSVHRGKLIAVEADHLTLDGKLTTRPEDPGTPCKVHLDPTRVLEVVDAGMITAVIPPQFSNRPPVGLVKS